MLFLLVISVAILYSAEWQEDKINDKLEWFWKEELAV